MAVLAGVVLICGYAVVQWTGRFDDGLGQAATPQPPPPGVVDPVNRGILIEAGTFISGSDDWEFAARGSERRKYPWGDSEPTCERVHFRTCDPRGPVEVMARPEGATPEGIHDLAGNVAEWVAPIWFDPGRTPVNDDSRRLRGGSFLSPPFALRAAHRVRYLYSGFESEDVGFRVVWALDGGRN